MKARDVMVSPVVTVTPSASVKDVAKLFLKHSFSAVPVVDDRGAIVGIVSETDLMSRAEIGTHRQRSWWLRLLMDEHALAADYIKSHGLRVAEVMTLNVITASPETSLRDVVTLLEKHSIKRVPIVENGQLVGILSRANLVQALASAGSNLNIPPSDASIRDRLLKHLNSQPWAHTSLLNVTVNDGVIDLWGITTSDTERKALRVAAEAMPGARAVNDHLVAYRPASMI
jgi:CBS-domain-containing membrane protein